MREVILNKLNQMEKDFDIEILFAVEAGSRAWGFESTDSDYDVRFVYKHSVDTYLNLWRHSGNINIMDGDLDFVGWDIRKALHLVCKPNPTLIEWLMSPIQYKYMDSALLSKLFGIAQRTQYKRAMLFAYCSLGKNALKHKNFSIKHYLYAIRCAVVIRFLEDNEHGFPMVNILDLINTTELPTGVQGNIFDIIHEKKKMVESSTNFKRSDSLDAFVAKQFDYVDGLTIKKLPNAVEDEADRLFKEIIYS